MPEVNPVQSVSGTVSEGNLKITVNGVESGDIPLPESDSATELFPFYLTKSYNGKYNNTLNYRPGIQLKTSITGDSDRIYIPSTIPQYCKIEGHSGAYLSTYGTSYNFLIPSADIENEIKECLKNVDDGVYEVIAGIYYSGAIIFGGRHQNITISNHIVVNLPEISVNAGTSILDTNDILCLSVTKE